MKTHRFIDICSASALHKQASCKRHYWWRHGMTSDYGYDIWANRVDTVPTYNCIGIGTD